MLMGSSPRCSEEYHLGYQQPIKLKLKLHDDLLLSAYADIRSRNIRLCLDEISLSRRSIFIRWLHEVYILRLNRLVLELLVRRFLPAKADIAVMSSCFSSQILSIRAGIASMEDTSVGNHAFEPKIILRIALYPALNR